MRSLSLILPAAIFSVALTYQMTFASEKLDYETECQDVGKDLGYRDGYFEGVSLALKDTQQTKTQFHPQNIFPVASDDFTKAFSISNVKRSACERAKPQAYLMDYQTSHTGGMRDGYDVAKETIE